MHRELSETPSNRNKPELRRARGWLGTIILGVAMLAWVLLGFALASAEKSHYAPGTVLTVSTDIAISLPGGWADAGSDTLLGSAPVVIKKNGIIVAIDEADGEQSGRAVVAAKTDELSGRLKTFWLLPQTTSVTAAGDDRFSAFFTAQESGTPVYGEVVSFVHQGATISVTAIASQKHLGSLEGDLRALISSVTTTPEQVQ